MTLPRKELSREVRAQASMRIGKARISADAAGLTNIGLRAHCYIIAGRGISTSVASNEAVNQGEGMAFEELLHRL